MAVVVATRMVMRKRRYTPLFLMGSMSVARQAHRSDGFLGGKLRAEPRGGAFWTLTMWDGGRDMTAFRDSGVHQRLAPMAATWAGEAVFGIWNTEDERLPRWKEVGAKVAEHPNFAPLNDPAPAHAQQRVIGARWFGFDLPIPRARRRKRVSRSVESSPAEHAEQRRPAESTATPERLPRPSLSPLP